MSFEPISAGHDRWLSHDATQKRAAWEWAKSVSGDTAPAMESPRLPGGFARRNALRYVEVAFPEFRRAFKSKKAFLEAFDAAVVGGAIVPVGRRTFMVPYGDGRETSSGEPAQRPIRYDIYSRESVDRWATGGKAA